jgi:hypothetical protein
MGFSANKAYLESELEKYLRRLAMVEDFLKDHPSKTIQRRSISGHIYFYERFKRDGKAMSVFLSKSEEEAQKRSLELEKEIQLIKKFKSEKKELKRDIILIQRQLNIVTTAVRLHD